MGQRACADLLPFGALDTKIEEIPQLQDEKFLSFRISEVEPKQNKEALLISNSNNILPSNIKKSTSAKGSSQGKSESKSGDCCHSRHSQKSENFGSNGSAQGNYS